MGKEKENPDAPVGIPSLPRGKKPQLRRCAICNKNGHNKSTCPSFASAPAVPTQGQNGVPLKFFIHHVSHTPTASPHMIDLKSKNAGPWENIQTSSPKKTENPDYFFYHQTKQPSAPAPIPPALPLPISLPATPKKHSSLNFKNHGLDVKTVGRRFGEETKKLFLDIVSLSYWKNAAGELYADLCQFIPPRQLIKIVIATALLVIIPAQAKSYYYSLKSTGAEVAENSTAGFTALRDSTTALLSADISASQSSIANALRNFATAVDTMRTKHPYLLTVVSALPIIGGQIESKEKIISAGQAIALGNAYMLKGIAESAATPNKKFAEQLSTIISHFRAAAPNYARAIDELAAVHPETLPLEYQQSFGDLRMLFSAIVSDFNTIGGLGQSIQEIFGGTGLRRYLVIFQNPAELRPTGGFLGSYALIEIKDGKLRTLDIPAGGSYDLQGQLDQYLEPPAPLLLSNKRWEFQDANWFPHFPASAEKILWFYRHSRGITADGVIAINATVLEKLLASTGPITDQKRNLTLTADNALTTIQTVVEEGPEKAERRPKQILSDLAPQFINYLSALKPRALLPLLSQLSDALAKKEIQAYFTDQKSENAALSFGWGGEIIDASAGQDYLMVVNTNIQGQKSDARVKQTIKHQAAIQPDGSIIDTVTIARVHTGDSSEKLYGQTNIDYLRLYAPKGSELLYGSGFTWPDEKLFRAPENWYQKDTQLQNLEKETAIDSLSGTRITEEFGKTVFGNWLITEPGGASEAQFVYRLPFRAFEPIGKVKPTPWQIVTPPAELSKYQLVVQRQSGSESDFESQIIYPAGWQISWKEGENISPATNGVFVAPAPLSKDTVWSLIMKHN